MKILTLHSDYIKFEAKKKALKDAEKIDKAIKEVKECLVVFTSVERADENKIEIVAKRYIKEVEDIARQVQTKSIVLYPYVHLSSSPSNPDAALKLLKIAEKELSKKYKVTRAPFGWYKAFEVRCKGHPLSELSRSFGGEGKTEELGDKGFVSKAVKEEEKLKSYWHIMDTNGKLTEIGKYNFKDHENLKKFAFYEKQKDRSVVKEPAHIHLMKKLELVDFEPASDGGNLRFYPKGRLMKSLMETFVTDKIIDYGGIEVETPIMYNMAHPSLEKYLNKFPARQYNIVSDKKNFFLRFSACFGQFLMTHDATLSYKDLPFKIYELTRYSFRKEQSGELCALRRLRAFTMPDVHALCRDMEQAKEEYKKRFQLCLDVTKGLGFEPKDLELAVRFTKDFYKKNKALVEGIVKKYGKPALIEMWDERKFYFVLKYELNFVDSVDKAAALATDQMDVENGERYEMKFTDKDGKKKYPIVLHCSPSGAIERDFYALLEKAYFEEKAGRTPMLPLWLSPVQVRIIPVSEKYNKDGMRLMQEIEKEGIRADIDDRLLHVGKKIRSASMEWVPYIIVIGEKELKSKKYAVRIRGKKDIKEMGSAELVSEIKKKTAGFPFKKLSLPKELSRRPIFVSQ